jgi:hypothetical protein
MRIERRHQRQENITDERTALEEMTSSIIRSGPVCAPDCERAKCQSCSRACPYIPQILSSDPALHPLEPKIAPLAFEIKKLGVFWPCWSCEGHNDQHNNLLKRPAVWFYASSVIHLRVLGEAIADMGFENQLSSPWQLRLCFSDSDNVSTTFSLEPVPNGPEITLCALQNDIARIAEQIEARVARKVESLKGIV